MKLVPIDRYWHSHEYQMSSLALALQWWIPAEFIIEGPSNETAGHVSGPNSILSNFKLSHLFHLLFVKWTEKIGGEKQLEDTRGKNVTHHRLHWGFDIIQYSTFRNVIPVCKGSIKKDESFTLFQIKPFA